MSSENEEKRRGLDMAFIFTYNYSWIRDKLIMNELIVNCFDDFLKLLYDKTDFRFRNEQREEFFMMTQIESIAFAVKYSEDLGAISIAFGKEHFKINETLRTYKTALIKDFFKNIHSANYEYVRKILGYPELEKFAPEQKEMMQKSVEQAKQYYSQIGAFYNKNNICIIAINMDCG